MSQQYDRKAIAIVGDDNATKIEGLKFTFTVTRTVQGYPNTIEIHHDKNVEQCRSSKAS